MNICFLCREYDGSMGCGGIGTFTYLITSSLSEMGYKVFVINISTQEKIYKIDNIVVYSKKLLYIPLIPRISKLLGLENFYLRLVNALTNYLALRNLMKIYKIDLIEYPDWFAEGLFVKLIKNVTSVVRIHGTLNMIAKYLPKGKTIENLLISLIENIAIKQANGVIFPSAQLINDIKIKLKDKKYAVIHHPFCIPKDVDFKSFQKFKDRDKLRIICVGRIEPRKNQEVLIKALPILLQKIKNLELIFIGKFSWKSYKNYIFSIIENFSLEKYIKFIGELPWSEMYNLLSSSDLVCVPSKYETFGYTFIEALASGVPVIASDIPVFREIAKEEICLFVDPINYEDWAKKIIFLYENKDLGKRIAQKAKLFVEREFSKEKITNKCINFYKEIISFYAKRTVS